MPSYYTITMVGRPQPEAIESVHREHVANAVRSLSNPINALRKPFPWQLCVLPCQCEQPHEAGTCAKGMVCSSRSRPCASSGSSRPPLCASASYVCACSTTFTNHYKHTSGSSPAPCCCVTACCMYGFSSKAGQWSLHSSTMAHKEQRRHGNLGGVDASRTPSRCACTSRWSSAFSQGRNPRHGRQRYQGVQIGKLCQQLHRHLHAPNASDYTPRTGPTRSNTYSSMGFL